MPQNSLLPQEDGQFAQVYSRIDANQRTAPVPPGRVSHRGNALSKIYDLAELLVSLRIFGSTCCMPCPKFVYCHEGEDAVHFPSLAVLRCTCLFRIHAVEPRQFPCSILYSQLDWRCLMFRSRFASRKILVPRTDGRCLP